MVSNKQIKNISYELSDCILGNYNKKRPIKTFDYYVKKYSDQGYSGSDLWKKSKDYGYKNTNLITSTQWNQDNANSSIVLQNNNVVQGQDFEKVETIIPLIVAAAATAGLAYKGEGDAFNGAKELRQEFNETEVGQAVAKGSEIIATNIIKGADYSLEALTNEEGLATKALIELNEQYQKLPEGTRDVLDFAGFVFAAAGSAQLGKAATHKILKQSSSKDFNYDNPAELFPEFENTKLVNNDKNNIVFNDEYNNLNKPDIDLGGAGNNSPGKADFYVKSDGTAIPRLRIEYENEVSDLSGLVSTLRNKGNSSEEIAKIVVPKRNDLKEKYRELTSPDLVRKYEQRNVKKYGHPVGPTAEQLKSQGKTWDEIIDGSFRTGGGDLGF